ncbi:MAG: peptidylprolyl isomerase [Alphaproteobacteria bacterium]
MRFSVSVGALALALCGGLTATGLAQDGAAPNPETVVATVGGDEITLADVVQLYQELPEQYRQIPFEMIYANLLENAIDSHLLIAAARSAGMENDPQVVDAVARFTERVMQQAYLDNEIQSQLTDEVLQARYDEQIGAAPEEFEVRASHILVETKEEAEEIIGLLDGGADFATLAAERSTGPSGPSGGDLGYFGAGPTRMVPEFEQAAFALEIGHYSEEPVQTQFGWHVILVTDKRAVEKASFEEVRDQLRGEMANQVVTDVLADLREDVEIAKFNPDGSPLAEPPAEEEQPAPAE